ncbi:MAG: trypsin-like peptidase domain-containing protein [Candidatus Kaiserbacteria bacterium]|nr:MAG: trypsin-like peptidase domain-containing protein [Candidatus Kaiserbacteria bacterium]
MYARIQPLFTIIGIMGVFGLALLLFTAPAAPEVIVSTDSAATSSSQVASAVAADVASTSPVAPDSPAVASPAPTAVVSSAPATEHEPATGEVRRIENPYSTPPQSFDLTNQQARDALVNILCTSGADSLRPISGSGVIIDPRGIILTNAHVAQYVLLSQSSAVRLTCDIRYGSPARALWSAEMLFMPTAWLEEHAKDITLERPTGTGEHDYALLRITGARNGALLPASFPFVPYDTREGITFEDDSVLAASYPAEFVGGITSRFDLYAVSSVTEIKNLLTFAENTIDLVSLGGIIGAQSGSSGGAVVNEWGRLVGIITTTSDGKTTQERDLRAVTLSYIDRDIKTQTGSDLASLFAGDVAAKAAEFRSNTAPHLMRLLIDELIAR